MAQTSLFITDSSGKRVGVLFLDAQPGARGSPPTTAFQSSQDSPFQTSDYFESVHIDRKNIWSSDGFTFAVAGCFAGALLAFLAWWYELDAGILVAGGAMVTGIGLHVLKIWLHRPPRVESKTPKETTIRIEQWDFEKGQAILQEFQDKRITVDLLQAVAKAVVKDGEAFSRPALTRAAKISQNQYHILKSEFERLHFCYSDSKARRTVLLRAGRAFLREVAGGAK